MGSVRNLTRKQKILVAGKGLVAEHWWAVQETPDVLILVSKKSGQRRTVKK